MKALKRGDVYQTDNAPSEMCPLIAPWNPYGEGMPHSIEVVSDDGVRLNILGDPLRSVLVRCLGCGLSWTFQDAAREP